MSIIQNLLKFQEVDLQLRAVETEVENNEDYRLANKAKAEVLDARARIDACEKKADEISTAFERLKTTFTDLNGKIAAYKTDLDECGVEDDTEYLENSLKKLEDNLAGVENELTALMKLADEVDRTNEESKLANKKFKAVFDEKKANYDRFFATKQGIMSRLKEQLKGMRSGVDEKYLHKYDLLRKDKIFPGLTPLMVDGKINRCGTCRMELDLNTANELRTNGVVECDSCRRIIYLPDQT